MGGQTKHVKRAKRETKHPWWCECREGNRKWITRTQWKRIWKREEQ